MNKIGIVFAMLISSMGFASVSVHDNAGVISAPQQSALIAGSARWPFDLHILTGAFPNPAALDTTVHRCVTGPNVVCIGIDPVHHKTNVHVGTGVGIPSSEFHSIAAAGNSYFKGGDYQGGIEAIAIRAREAAHTIVNASVREPVRSVSVQSVPVPVQVHIDNHNSGMSTGWWLFAFFMALLLGLGAWIVRRAYKTAKKVNDDMNDFRDEAFEMSSRNMEERDFHEKLKAKLGTEKKPMLPKVAQSAPTSVPVSSKPTIIRNRTTVEAFYNTPSVSPSTTDVLLAYELGRVSNPTPPVVVVPVPAPVPTPTPAVDKGGSSSDWDTKADDNDSGGSSSSHDDDNDNSGSSSWNDSSDSSSSDNGSSSSSWDSGSSDSGSSGGDSGGGDSGW